jgi:hypothetical protein
MKQYEVEVYPGTYKNGFAVEVFTGDRVVVIVQANDGARAQEVATAMFGGPDRCRTSTIREHRG